VDLDRSVFAIDAASYVERLCNFIQSTTAALHRDGVLVALSGGLDSSTVLLLCARAVGAEKVTALLMPERQGNPEAGRYSRLITGRFGIKTIVRNISSILARLGTYNFILSAIPFRGLQNWAARHYLGSSRRNPFLQIVRGEANRFQRKGFARYNTKHRVRAVVAYLVAEERNLLVAGCAHKSEDMLGLFVKFGIDASADIMPLQNLYRSQIIQLAGYLDVPDEIVKRTPNPDIMPGVSDKYVDILGLGSDTLDLLLYGIEHGLEDNDIAPQLDLPIERVKQIRQLVQETEHMRNPSQALSWE
jgi:NAD+ synthase